MIKTDLIRRIASETGLSKLQAEVALDSMLDLIKDALIEGERIELRGFGVFEVRRRKPSIGRNPRTREEVPIPSSMTVRFKPGKQFQSDWTSQDAMPEAESEPATAAPARAKAESPAAKPKPPAPKPDPRESDPGWGFLDVR